MLAAACYLMACKLICSAKANSKLVTYPRVDNLWLFKPSLAVCCLGEFKLGNFFSCNRMSGSGGKSSIT